VERMRGSARVRVAVGVLVVAFLLAGVGQARADAPDITDVVPGEGPVGTAVTISGSGFAAATEVAFNGVDDPGFTVVDDGTIDATVPDGATTGPLTVTTPEGTAVGDESFIVDVPPPPPSITGFEPGHGPVGTTVTIRGTSLAGATEVSFNGVDDPGFTIVDDATIEADVPLGAGSGPIRVVVDGTTIASDATFGVDPPNIVVLLTDDQRWDQLGSWMPTVASDIAAKGVTFPNGFVINPLCCPSRATILTGQTSGHTGVWANGGAFGGFAAFHDSSTVATWLHGAGYRTGLFGKYLNNYKKANIPYVPPGWDEWDAMALGGSLQCRGQGYFNYCLSHDGVEEDHGAAESDYSTDVVGQKAASFIDSTPEGQPLFLYFAPRAPHAPTTPPHRYVSACGDAALPAPPSMNEADVSDKPAFIQGRAVWTAKRIAAQQRHWIRSCQTLRAVDDAVARILSELTATGRISNTLILFASDNGLLYGEHRWLGKTVPYEESIRIPIMIRYDPLTHGAPTTNEDPVLNADFASTFADAAGVVPGLPQDGRSLVPLLSDPSAPWRTAFLLEHFGPKVPAYCGIRTEHMTYVRYATGEEELYDLSVDAYENGNVASSPAYADVLANLRAETRTLCDPPPPNWSWPP
jgi:arylsulfatase A-like enzyme